MSDSIRPFEISVPDSAIADLRERLARTRWPSAEVVDDWSQGMPLAYAKDLCAYWADGYDWRRFEAELNGFPNFLTEIEGLDVHFIHVRSPHEHARPLIVTHGWPGSVAEFTAVIGPLVDPTAHGGSADDAFHVVVPSIPGYGWSAAPIATGMSPVAVGRMWAALMERLGYQQFYAQGGDWGAVVTANLAIQHPDRVLGIHTNMPVAGPKGDPADDDELAAAFRARRAYYDSQASGYFAIQASRPQTLGYGITDSPAGLAGWIGEKMWDWTDNGGSPEDALSRDQILDNISLYWFTETAVSSCRFYWEGTRDFDPSPIEVPCAVSMFRHEVLPTTRAWAEDRYTDIRYWADLPEGGHFAAWERPADFVAEVRAGIAALQ